MSEGLSTYMGMARFPGYPGIVRVIYSLNSPVKVSDSV